MTATTLPTSRIVTQDWDQDFEWLNGVHYPNGFYDSIGWRGHNGIDYGCWVGDPVEAVCDGVIDFAGDGTNHWLLSGGGNAVLLRSALGVQFEYLHLSRFAVSKGQSVKRGQVIAYSGNTGISTAPHLHLGAIPLTNINVNNGYRGRIDPTPYLYGSMNPDYAGAAAIGAQSSTPQELFTMAQFDDLKGFHANSHAKLNNIAKAVNDIAAKNQSYHSQSHAKLNAIKSVVDQIATGQNVTIDWDEVERRAEAGAAKAMAEGIVAVDVTIQGKESS